MKKRINSFYWPLYMVAVLAVYCTLNGCQSESLDIRANYRIKLQASPPGTTLKAQTPYSIPLTLFTDSYYSEYGYQLQFYQQAGLGRLEKSITGGEFVPVLQNVGVPLPLGQSNWVYTPEAAGTSQVVFIAQQTNNYTKPDTIRLNFTIIK